jgi:hypothetical protein
MSDHPITIAGIFIPTNDPLFLTVLAFHVPAGLVCVVTGVVAMLSRKQRGNHTKAGLMYYRFLIVVFVTMSALAAMRWAHAYHLFVLGVLSIGSAYVARRSIVGRGSWRIRTHVLGMGASYVLLLVAFYVDNGKSLPLWKDLPAFTYWAIPVGVGIPFILRAFFRHPLGNAERRKA